MLNGACRSSLTRTGNAASAGRQASSVRRQRLATRRRPDRVLVSACGWRPLTSTRSLSGNWLPASRRGVRRSNRRRGASGTTPARTNARTPLLRLPLPRSSDSTPVQQWRMPNYPRLRSSRSHRWSSRRHRRSSRWNRRPSRKFLRWPDPGLVGGASGQTAQATASATHADVPAGQTAPSASLAGWSPFQIKKTPAELTETARLADDLSPRLEQGRTM